MHSSPVRRSPPGCPALPLDLHVLGLPPAFTLSQDQTLQLDLLTYVYYLRSSSLHKCLLVTPLISMDFNSIKRRPHKTPAHTVKDRLRNVRVAASVNPNISSE